jgi:hypothetical protein
MLSLIPAKFYESKHCCHWFEQSEREETTWEVKNEESQTQNSKGGKLNETKQNGRKPKGQEHRKANDFLTLTAQSMSSVKVASPLRAPLDFPFSE